MNNGKKEPTIYDISKMTGVSVSTVSRVINGSARVSEEKRRQVEDAIRKSGFKPNELARSLVNSQSRTIGCILPDNKNSYFASLYFELESLASERGYAVLLTNSHSDYERESAILNLLVSKRVDAIVFMGGRIDTNTCAPAYHHELEALDKTVPILLTSRLETVALPQVYEEQEEAVRQLVGHLKRQGCRSLGVLGGSDEVNISIQRRDWLLKYGAEAGLETRPEWVAMKGHFSIEEGALCAKELLQNVDTPDAFCCVNDSVAFGAVGYIQSLGLSVPEDIMITGFDGTFLSTSVYPGITTVRTEFTEYANKIFEILLRRIGHEPYEVINPIQSKVMVLGSTRRSKRKNSTHKDRTAPPVQPGETP